MKRVLLVSLVAAAATVLVTVPASAQGRGNAPGQMVRQQTPGHLMQLDPTWRETGRERRGRHVSRRGMSCVRIPIGERQPGSGVAHQRMLRATPSAKGRKSRGPRARVGGKRAAHGLRICFARATM